MKPLKEWATLFIEAGMSIIPIGMNKQPNFEFLPINPDTQKRTWAPFQQKRATLEQALLWCASPRTTGLGLVCGDISGGLRCIDFDDEKAFNDWIDIIGEQRIDGCLVTKSSQGFHVIHRMFHPRGNQVFAQKRLSDGSLKALIETRENGGYCVLPESRHPKGHIYTFLPRYDDVMNIRIVMPEEELLWERSAQQLTQVVVEHIPQRNKSPQLLSRAAVVMEAFNEQHSVHDFLIEAGCTQVHASGYRRDGGHKTSIIVGNRDGKEVSIHFNVHDMCNDVSLFGRPHDAFDWFQILRHNNDIHAALTQAAEICNIPWDVYEPVKNPIYTVDESIRFFDGDGETVILTDSQEVAELLQSNNLPVMLGPTAMWYRKALEQIEDFTNRIVVFAGSSDAANRTARELDAKVLNFREGVIAFIRQNTIEEFAVRLRFAEAPKR